MPDKRRKKRYKVGGLEVHFTEENLFSFLKGSREGRAALIDMSGGGLQFLSTRSLKPGDSVKLSVQGRMFPEPVEVNGTVRWCQQIPRKTSFKVGVELVKLDEETEKRLAEFESWVTELSIRVLCVNCGASFSVKKKHEGKKGKCPKCGNVVEIVETVPSGPTADAGKHVSASAVTSDAAAAGTHAASAVRGGLDPSLQKFIMRYFPTRAHLALFEHCARGNASVVSPKEVAGILNERERVMRRVCADMVKWGILKEVGVRTYNFALPPGVRDDAKALVRSLTDVRTRATVLGFVLGLERER